MSNENIKKSDIAKKEEEILEFWNKNEIFKKSLEKESPKGEFVFYDGPVTSNSKPVFHTMEPFSFKDIIPKYKTMRGYHVRRKGGWDTHGLPVELQVEKKLGFKSKKDIEEYGIEAFNKLCKESVWEYIELWKDFTKRMGYWADQDNAYVTYHNSYIESIWNILKTIEGKKLLYKDYKVLPWCPRCGTALSSHELAQGYEDDKDLSVTAKFKLKGMDNTYILAWTTTPWTLPGNVALAVGNEIKYVKVKTKEGILILAKERMISLVKDVPEEFVIEKEFIGRDLVGLEYESLYPFMKEKFEGKNPEAFAKAYKVYPADFVTTEEGTGVVHTAVMYGQDDFVLGTLIGLPKFHLVKDDGNFLDGMNFLSGRFVKDEEVAVDIIKDLAHRGLLFKKEKYEHSYPHCWRCKTPLIYYARDSWYIKMSSLRDKLVSENEKINWEPSYIKEGRFGEWLREIKDWAISRERYWGTPLPVWVDKDGKYKVIGGIDELKQRTKSNKNHFIILRHGQAENNTRGIVSSKKDDSIHITEKGREELIDVTRKFNKEGTKVSAIYSSPLVRTKESAEIFAKEVGLESDVIYDDRLAEYGFGDFEGKPFKDFLEFEEKYMKEFETPVPNGESYLDAKKRFGSFLYDVDSKHKGKTILVVTHGIGHEVLEAVIEGADSKRSKYLIDNSNYGTAGILEFDFVPIPHNEKYELDLHRPFIDTIEIVDENGNSLNRVKEVLDVWFDSGAMPFAQDNYPFSTKDILYPADYICEAIDQTRGWFYTLHAIGVLMDKGRAFNNVISLGHVLDSQGKKMSKSLGNVLDPWIMIDKYGVDALRIWMYSINQPGDSKNFDEKTVDEVVKKVFNPLENIFALYELYKDDTILVSDKSNNILDKWILSKLSELISLGTENLDRYKVFEATRSIKDFVNDFSTWYIRRSRNRIKSVNKEERNEALSTTKFILLNLMKYMAPFTPFFADIIYIRLRTELDPESVHLCDWPEPRELNTKLLEDMVSVREIVTKALELRQKAGIKVRQPLKNLKIKNKKSKFGEELVEIIKDEINVKEVLIDDNLETEVWLDTDITKDLKEEGLARDIIRGIQDTRKKEGLSPNQEIKLVLNVSEEIAKIIGLYKEMIMSPTQSTDLAFSNDTQKHEFEAGDSKISVTINF